MQLGLCRPLPASTVTSLCAQSLCSRICITLLTVHVLTNKDESDQGEREKMQINLGDNTVKGRRVDHSPGIVLVTYQWNGARTVGGELSVVVGFVLSGTHG